MCDRGVHMCGLRKAVLGRRKAVRMIQLGIMSGCEWVLLIVDE
jgi:hypothetical protein